MGSFWPLNETHHIVIYYAGLRKSLADWLGEKCWVDDVVKVWGGGLGCPGCQSLTLELRLRSPFAR